jgi:hypothetical protein
VVAQCLNAEMPARHPRPATTVALWQPAQGAAPRRALHIEAAGLVLAALEKRPDISATLNVSFERMLARYREVQREMPQLAAKPKKRDFRRKRRA